MVLVNGLAPADSVVPGRHGRSRTFARVIAVGLAVAVTPMAATVSFAPGAAPAGAAASADVTGAATSANGGVWVTSEAGAVRGFGRRPVLGVLQADPTWLSQDQAAGVRLAMLNVDWSRWQPRAGVTDPSYVAYIVGAAAQYRAAGWQVAVDVGLQQPPAWVTQMPNGQLVDQTGRPSDSANYEFNQAVRNATGVYIANIVSALGPVKSYRVGLSDAGEMTYPITTAGQWLAFDAIAQGRASGLPAGVGSDPMPGWVPGAATRNGAPVTTSQVQGWYDWYLGALTSAEAWQIGAYRAAGFNGQVQLVMPGDGASPTLYSKRIADNLASEPYDGYGTMNSGAVWWKVLDQLPNLANTAIDISSVGDQSGSATQKVCQAGDDTTSLSGADPWSSGWSDTRWLTFLARQHHLPVMGENPGNTAANDVAAIVALTKGCGLTTLQWAWDYQLNQGLGYATLAQVAQALRSASAP